jgi:hypothetical protein
MVICIWETIGLNFSWDTCYPTVFRGIPQSLWANIALVPRSGHDRFLPNPFQFISHRSSYHSQAILSEISTTSEHKPHMKTNSKFENNMKNAVFWDVEPCTPVVNRRFGGKYCLHLLGRKIPERGTSMRRWMQLSKTQILHSK